MGTVLVYDSDFFHYPRVIPNLECAKYAAWRKKKRDIVVCSPNLDPPRYSSVFFRKEYDDGIYNDKVLLPNVEYGGRAFSEVYRPFPLEMERIVPDFTIYNNYRELYGKRKVDREEIGVILNATHARLSLDGKTLEPFPFDRLRPRHPCVIVHDYDLGNVPGAFELLQEVAASRPSGLSYRIGNKYPINVYNFQDLQKWLKLPPMGTCFYLQFNGVFTDEEIIELIHTPTLGLRQMVYNFTYNCPSEEVFVEKVLPQIYKQALFLRSHKQKILLNIDTEFFKTKELFDLIKLIDCFYGKTKNLEYIIPQSQTLYGYCSWNKRAELEVLPWVHFRVSLQEMRASFQYVRKHNYEVFDMFYSMPNVIPKGGKLVNEWS